MGLASESHIPDTVIFSAEVVNSCGLQLSADKLCAESCHHKEWDVCGDINVCEKIESCGVDGNKEYTKGRYSLSAQQVELVGDQCVPDLSADCGLCHEAGDNAHDASSCC